jgi:hypothetical protein
LFLDQTSFKMKQVLMHKMILILMFFHCSCKNSNTSEYNNSTKVDSIIIDSNTIKEDNFELDIQLKRMHENKLFYKEVIQSN